MSRRRKILLITLSLLLLAAALVAWKMVLPKPQASFTSLQPAPDFTLNDQDGKPFTLSSLRGTRVVLVFYRGYWWPVCVRQLREFAQHAGEFEQAKARLVAISVDDQEHAHLVWDKQAAHQFVILSDPEARVIRQYGLLHLHGKGDTDIAIRTTFVIDEDGRERWRKVSATIPEIPKAAEVLQELRGMQ